MEGSVEVPLVDVKPEEKQPLNENAASKPDYGTGTSKPDFLEDLDPSDPNFWREVSSKFKEAKKEAKPGEAVSWSKCLDKVRAERIKKKYDTFSLRSLQGTDPVVLMVTEWYEKFRSYKKDKPELFPSFERQISKLAEILIDEEFKRAEKERDDSRYIKRIVKDREEEKTLLHVAAERNLVLIAECLLKYDRDLVYKTTFRGKSNMLPVELALREDCMHDDVASLLIKNMWNKKRVRMLFECDYGVEPPKPPPFKFKTLVKNKKMEKTVMAILDSLINSDWPYIPVKNKDEADKEWHSVPDIPIRYHFYYRILDGDDEGRAPKIPDTNGLRDENFQYRSTSCLQELCQSTHKKVAIRHPVIHVLAARKWKNFGERMIWFYCSLYLFYLVMLSCSLLGAVHSKDPTKYTTTLERLRGVCEVITILMSVCYLITEIDQMVRERCQYWCDFYNYADLFGLLGIFAIMALRLANSPIQWHVAAIVFIINFARILKFFPAWPMVGLYSKILMNLVWTDMRMFLVVYFLVLFAFSGGTYLSFRATTKYNTTTGFDSAKVKGFGDILLRGVRALAEGEPFADSYDNFNAYPVILILLNMFVIMIFLVNILIAQLSAKYEDAEKEAALQYNIDKAIFVTRIENSLLSCLGNMMLVRRNIPNPRIQLIRMLLVQNIVPVNYQETSTRSWKDEIKSPRIKYYIEGDYINEASLIEDVLAGWKLLHPDETKDTQVVEFRKVMKGAGLINQ